IDDFCIVETLCLVDSLLQDLPYRKGLDRIRADISRAAAELLDESGDKEIVLVGLDRRPPPAVRDEHSLGVLRPNGLGKSGTLIGSRSSDKYLGIVMLRRKILQIGSAFRQRRGTQDSHICV